MVDPSSECPDDESLVGFAEGLLSEADRHRVEDHLDTCPTCREIVGAAATTQNPDEEAPVGRTRGGRYVVLEQVGRGAMGRVLRAYDPELHREVALKEILGVNSPRARARLVAEARGLARLSHPNVVAVYDVLTPAADDEPGAEDVTVVMEYVAGMSLARWLDASKPTWQEVLRRYREAGKGLVAAHAAGLLHRDFKPSNVLVDDDVVKVADFGLVQVVDEAPSTLGASGSGSGSGSDEAPNKLTQTGTTVGTPAYMAPEQHLSEPLSEAADQYAFCVSLWRGLCGELPFRGAGLWRAKTEGPPEWSNAAVPRQVVDAIRRGLSPHPPDRWPRMQDLLDALAFEEAARRRRRQAVVAGVGLLGLIAIGIGVTRRGELCRGGAAQLAGAWDETRRDQVRAAIEGTRVAFAPEVWSRVEADLDAYADAWVAMHRDACEATAVDGVQSAALLDLRMACLGRARQQLAATVDVLADADPDVVANAHELSGGLPALTRCGDLDALQADDEPPLPEDVATVEEIRTRLAAAAAAGLAGRFDDAREKVDAAASLVGDVRYPPVEADIAIERGRIDNNAGDYAGARKALEQGLRIAAAHRNTGAMYEAAWRLLFVIGVQQEKFAEASSYLQMARGLAADDPLRRAQVCDVDARLLDVQGKYDEGAAEAREALALREEVLRPGHPDVAASRHTLAAILHKQGKYDEALAELRTALAAIEETVGPKHPEAAGTRATIAGTLNAAGKSAEAEEEARRALALREAGLPPGHPDIAKTRAILGLALFHQARYPEAETVLRRALQESEAALGAGATPVAAIRNNLGTTLIAQRKYAEATALYRTALEVLERVVGPEHPHVQLARANLANLLIEQHDFAAGEALHREVLAVRERTLGVSHPSVAESLTNLAFVLQAQHKDAEAEAMFRRALAATEAALGDDHLDTARARTNLANALLSRGNAAEACTLGQASWRRWEQDDVPHGERPDAAFVTARACLAVAEIDRARAKALGQRARAEYATSDQSERVDAVDEWLADAAL